MHHRHRRKTAEKRFNTLARGWLAYPVTPMHAHLPPKSGCRNAIPVCARGALLLVTPSARRDSGGRMGHRRAPPLCASEMRYFPLSARCTIIEKTATHRLAYPVTPTHHPSTAFGGCRRPRRAKKKTDGWDSNHRSLYRYVLLCDYLLTTRRSLIRAFLPVRLRR